MPLNAFDMYGRTVVSALLRDGASHEVLTALRALMDVVGAAFTIEEVAAEIGVTLPAPPLPVPVDTRPARAAVRPKRRAA